MRIRIFFNKLVRSSIFKDSDSWAKGSAISSRDLNLTEYKIELFKKLQEECLEVVGAVNIEDLQIEIGDVYDVLDEIIKTHNISKDRINDFRLDKTRQRGILDKKNFINYIEFDESNPRKKEREDYCKYNCNNYKIINISKHIVDFIIYKDGKIYIQKRSKQSNIYPNVWELPGGKIEPNENFQQCIKRELKEEMNLELSKNNGIIFEEVYNFDNENIAYTVFHIDAKDFHNFKLEENGATEFKWISKDEVNQFLNIKRHDNGISPVYLAALKFFESSKIL